MNRSRARTVMMYILLAPIGAMVGCRAGGNQSVSDANDQLRRENLELRQSVATLMGEKQELGLKVQESERVRSEALPAEVLAAIPRCTEIEIGSLTGFDPADPQKPAIGVTAYIKAHDGRGRFVQVVGTLRVVVLVLPASLEIGASETADAAALEKNAVSVTRIEMGPERVREAYREGFLGTAYEVALKFERPLVDRRSKLLVRAEFSDALTGTLHAAQFLR